MSVRSQVSCAGVLVVVTLIAGAVSAQTPQRSPTAAATGASSYTPPKTPWGDPDLQATWPGDSGFVIPLQRPKELGTKAELTDEEFAAKLARDDRTRKTAENAVGSFRNDNSWLTRSFRQTSLVVDPPD